MVAEERAEEDAKKEAEVARKKAIAAASAKVRRCRLIPDHVIDLRWSLFKYRYSLMLYCIVI